MAKTKEVWCGAGVLWVGRKKVKEGDEIPANLDAKARKSLKAKDCIKEVIIEKPNTDALDAAVKAAKKAEAVSGKAADEASKHAEVAATATKAVQTAKGARTKADKAAKVAGASEDLKAKAVEADKAVGVAETELTAVTAAQAELGDANALAETAVRLRMEADKLAND